MIGGRLNRYMMTQTLTGLGLAALTISTVIILVDFVEQSRAIGTRVDASTLDLLSLTLLKTPALLETTLPFIFLFGILTSLFRLNRRSELIVMRASGMSAWRILTAPMLLAICAGIAGAVALNPLAAMGSAEFQNRRDQLMNVQRATGVEEPIWLRETSEDGFTVIAATALQENRQELMDPTFYIFTLDENGVPNLDRRIDAAQARLSDGFWQIIDAVERSPNAPTRTLQEETLPTQINRQALFERSRSPEGVSFWDLPQLISSAREAGLATERYELRWHSLLALPLTLLAATLIAAAATLRLHRLGGAAAFALAGGLAGFVMFFLQELLGSMGTTGALPPLTAAWAAPALTALIALTYIASTEDG
ncbi:LPS export ABC transporter permease LptG [Maricaulis parjimensis]|uniref:LPS export ABC transporter permease LptG n=1 Tax=Maricaulis parjimensis TaxID=144023 RepID=UPI001939288C|nr:LPS export ABC transporter permease LptG [Maricaulis parjimensis]